MSTKKKETLWQLLTRLDEEAGQFNIHLHQANRYFDTAATEANKLLKKHERDLHKTIGEVKKALKIFLKKEDTKKDKKDN